MDNFATPQFRLSYPSLFTPTAASKEPGAKKMYSVTMLFKKNIDIRNITRELKKAKTEKWGADETKWPKRLLSPIQDGDSDTFADNPEAHGCWVVKASSNEDFKPVVVDANNEDIINKSEIYAGCICIANVKAHAYDTVQKGAKLILNGVKKIKDGEPIGKGRPDASSLFGPAAGLDAETDMQDDEDDI
jgi:hypothetical protein